MRSGHQTRRPGPNHHNITDHMASELLVIHRMMACVISLSRKSVSAPPPQLHVVFRIPPLQSGQKDYGLRARIATSAFRPYLDAANVDLKAFQNSTYKRYVGARLQPVLDSIKEMKRLGIWLEVTTLLIPGLNDGPAELRDATAFLAREVGRDTPWHISRFCPAWQMSDWPPTPIEALRRAREIGREEGLRHIYIGNIREEGAQDTVCPDCDRVLIRRHGFRAIANHVQDDHCPDCGAPVAGVGMNDRTRSGKQQQEPFP